MVVVKEVFFLEEEGEGRDVYNNNIILKKEEATGSGSVK